MGQPRTSVKLLANRDTLGLAHISSGIMARNSEKSQSFFSQVKSLIEDESGPQRSKGRPRMASDCDNLQEAEKWRRNVIGEAMQKVAAITKANGMGEYRIREVNDEINKLLNIRRHWERRIHELGGPNLSTTKIELDIEGKALPGTKGYKYYGAAKELPGVKEKFQEQEKDEKKAEKKEKRRPRQEILKNLGSEYYGGKEDKELERLEAKRERVLVAEAVRAYQVSTGIGQKEKSNQGKRGREDESDLEEEELHAWLNGNTSFVSNASAAPSSHCDPGGESALLATSKEALLSKYL